MGWNAGEQMAAYLYHAMCPIRSSLVYNALICLVLLSPISLLYPSLLYPTILSHSVRSPSTSYPMCSPLRDPILSLLPLSPSSTASIEGREHRPLPNALSSPFTHHLTQCGTYPSLLALSCKHKIPPGVKYINSI